MHARAHSLSETLAVRSYPLLALVENLSSTLFFLVIIDVLMHGQNVLPIVSSYFVYGYITYSKFDVHREKGNELSTIKGIAKHRSLQRSIVILLTNDLTCDR